MINCTNCSALFTSYPFWKIKHTFCLMLPTQSTLMTISIIGLLLLVSGAHEQWTRFHDNPKYVTHFQSFRIFSDTISIMRQNSFHIWKLFSSKWRLISIVMAPGRQCKLHAPSPPLAAHGLLLVYMINVLSCKF